MAEDNLSKKISKLMKMNRDLELFKVVFENTPETIFLTDNNGKIIDCSNAASSLYCYSKTTFLTLSITDIIDEKTADKLPELLKEETQTGGISLELSHIKSTGELFPVSMTTKVFDFNNKNFRLVVVRELPKKQEETTGEENSEENFKALSAILPEMSTDPEILFEFDLDGRIIKANQTFFDKTGYTRDDIKSGLIVNSILLSEHDFDLLNSIQTNSVKEINDFNFSCKNKNVFPVTGLLKKVYHRSKIKRYKAQFYDISEQKHFEQSLLMTEKLNALGETAGGVVHDFNNILSIILGNSDLLKNLSNNNDVRTISKKIKLAAIDGIKIVRRLHNFSQVYTQFNNEPVDLNGIITESIDLLEPQKKALEDVNGMTIRIDTEFDKIPPVLASSSELREVICNILLNSFEALKTGGTITIKTSLNDNFIILTMSDTGSGMSNETKERLFEPFYTTKSKNGTGLGMSITYGIIKKYGGEITVESEKGSGTRFTISFPVSRGEKPIEEIVTDTTDDEPFGDILVIDDEENICELLKDYLENEDIRVSIAVGGLKGLEYIKKHAFPIVLTDLNMPDISGWEIASYVKKNHPETAIIMFSGLEDSIENLNNKENIIDYILQKPISFSKLSDILTTLMNKK